MTRAPRLTVEDMKCGIYDEAAHLRAGSRSSSGSSLALALIEVDGDRLAVHRGRPLHAGRRAVRAHPEHLCARRDQGHGLPLRRHALSASLCGVRPPRQPAVRHALGQQCRPVRSGFPRRQADRPLRRHADRRLGRLAARPEPEAAGAALSRGGAEQEIRQPQRQAVDGAGRRRRRLEGAAAVHPVLALCQLGRRHDHRWAASTSTTTSGRMRTERLEGAGLQLPGGQSVRRRREFRRRGDRLGDGAHGRHAGAQSRSWASRMRPT